jgi:ribonuclease P protein component
MDRRLPGQSTRTPRPGLVTIRKTVEIDRVCHEGRSVASRLFVAIGLAAEENPSRVAIKVSRKVGTAVVRNRIRRQVKEIMKILFPALGKPCDLVVIARQGAVQARFGRKLDDLATLLVRLGFLTTNALSARSSGRSSR